MRKTVSFLAVIVLLLLSVALTGCKTLSPTVAIPRNDSIVLRYEYLHDSIYVDRIHYEKQKGDTVYLRDTVTLKYFSIKDKVDTLYLNKEVVITQPPEKYIPSFYKWCTGILIVLVILAGLYCVLRVVIRIYTKR